MCGTPFGDTLVVIVPLRCSSGTIIRLSTDSVIDVVCTFVVSYYRPVFSREKSGLNKKSYCTIAGLMAEVNVRYAGIGR